MVCTFFPQDNDDDGTSRPNRQDDKRIFFDDIFGSVSYEPEEKLPVSNCTCSECILIISHLIIMYLRFTDYIISCCKTIDTRYNKRINVTLLTQWYFNCVKTLIRKPFDLITNFRARFGNTNHTGYSGASALHDFRVRM